MAKTKKKVADDHKTVVKSWNKMQRRSKKRAEERNAWKTEMDNA